ncbi:MAG TPA: VOC family protein [Tahibacter sp.]|uniref:VOC family protein n=1 Tax=Tahibacter sp. TaxID=2056211 RepID=UPI002CAC50AB|nr:VOC family protein [Tahibacter sp.]HSX61688.1 VOC family protein [Tahibacter sp.]
MAITALVPQLRTTDLASSLHFYIDRLGFELAFRYEDFYAGVRAGPQLFHLKQWEEIDPSIRYVDDADHFHLYFQTGDLEATAARLSAQGIAFVRPIHETPWQTREFVIHDDQGHTLYFGEPQ